MLNSWQEGVLFLIELISGWKTRLNNQTDRQFLETETMFGSTIGSWFLLLGLPLTSFLEDGQRPSNIMQLEDCLLVLLSSLEFRFLFAIQILLSGGSPFREGIMP